MTELRGIKSDIQVTRKAEMLCGDHFKASRNGTRFEVANKPETHVDGFQVARISEKVNMQV